jgi:hypothetical protein
VKQPTGDFTRYFGHEDAATAEPFAQPQDQQTAPGSLTQLLSQTGAGKDGAKLGSVVLDTNPGLRPSPTPEPVAPVAPQFQQKAPAPLPDFAPLRPAPPVVPDRTFASSTEIFRTPRVEPPPVEHVSSGPSDFTMFIDRSRLSASLPPEPPSGAGAAGGGQPPVFIPPPLPAPPPIQFAPPPRPPMPPFPPPPALKPPVPTPPMPPAKAASYWPLITVLTVLVAIGALLVMYFVMKKH